jgi:hypothetical protein
MRQDRIDALNAIGPLWTWKINDGTHYDDPEIQPRVVSGLKRRFTAEECLWSAHYELVYAFCLARGHLPSPREVLDRMYIGAWLDDQRGLFERDQLSNVKKGMMRDIPGWVDPGTVMS